MTDIQNIRGCPDGWADQNGNVFQELEREVLQTGRDVSGHDARETVGEEGIEQMQTIDPETYQRVKELLKEAEDGGIRVSRARPLQYGKENKKNKKTKGGEVTVGNLVRNVNDFFGGQPAGMYPGIVSTVP
jgi:hypothetical protein